MSKEIISTDRAPAAIGTYSQAVRVDDTLYLSGQIGLDPLSMELAEGAREQIRRIFLNLAAVLESVGGSLGNIVKLNVYLTDLAEFGTVNEVMGELFEEPYPARAAVGVQALPKGAVVEIEGVAVLQR